MDYTERQKMILQLLSTQNAISIRKLAEMLYISEASIRRDVAVLEKDGAVRRIYGGVLLSDRANAVIPLVMRDGEHSSSKERIARIAASRIPNGATIMLDASSTVRRMTRYLANRKGLTIITNNARIFQYLPPTKARIYCTGGLYLEENHAYAGPAAEAFVRSVSVDMLFFSSQGLSLTGEVTDNSEIETSLRRAMLERAAQKFCLMDSSKLGVQGLFRVCGHDDVTEYISDRALPFESPSERSLPNE